MRITRTLALSFLFVACLPHFSSAQTATSGPATYTNPKASIEARVADLFSRLTEDEKLRLLGGTGFSTQPIPRLGVPGMFMCDAGQGVRGGAAGTLGKATLFPAEIDMAATWDRDLVRQIGSAIGEELLNKGPGSQILLGPDINIHRSPLGGRNGESFSEDPYLTAALVVPYVQGVQSTGASACVKHFVCNNEEQDRDYVDVKVDERALREIYLPGFRAGVTEGHAFCVMASYNKVRGAHATANKYLLTDVLDGDWGFDGLMMSDWGAVHETDAVDDGCDLEMPTGVFMSPARLAVALEIGDVSQAAVDEAVRRILRTIIRVGLLDPNRPKPNPGIVNSPEHRQLAYRAATEAIVLLKNDGGVLPLDRTRIRSIAVIGPSAAHIQGGADGSPQLTPFFQSEPLDAIKAMAGKSVTIHSVQGLELPKPQQNLPENALVTADGSPGLTGEYFDSNDFAGTPFLTRTDKTPQLWNDPSKPAPTNSAQAVRWTGYIQPPDSGIYTLQFFTNGGCRVWIGDSLVMDSPQKPNGWLHEASVNLVAEARYKLHVEMYRTEDTSGAELPEPGPVSVVGKLTWTLPEQDSFPEAVEAAAKSDVAIVFASTQGTDGEGRDRPSLTLPGNQDQLIDLVAHANKNTIVVLNTGTPCQLTAWLSDVPAVIDMGFPGEQGGNAVASILFGETVPSGKLVDTWGASRQDYPDYGNFPGTDGTVNYAEGIYVGYRYFDKNGITPVFPFGYGLSYTTFAYSDLRLSDTTLSPHGTLTAQVNVTNTGSRAGSEIVELYLHSAASRTDRPVRELKGFERIQLAPGEKGSVSFTVSPRDLCYYDAAGVRFRADRGPYEVQIGASARDIRETAGFELTGDYTASP